MERSQNGWPVNPARTSRTIPGTGVRVTVADGPAGDVLMYVLARIDAEVEDIDLRSTRGEFDDWGYAPRNVRGSSAVSNHASATAVDVNATRHPLGARGTFTPTQVRKIHEILRAAGNVVRWGGDYSGRKDEMHFEINADPARVTAVAARLGHHEEDDRMKNLILAQKINSKEIWVGDGLHRRHVTDMLEVQGLQYWIGQRGGDPDIKENWDDLRVLGIDITPEA